MEVVARCPDCGREDSESFVPCPWCGRSAPTRWWCVVCDEWRADRTCPVCAGGLGVPAELFLGSCVVGSAIDFRVIARNGGRKLLGCMITSPDPGVAITDPWLLVAPTDTAGVTGSVTVAAGEPGRHTFHLVFNTPVPAVTVLAVDVTAPAPRLEFFPPVVALHTPNPGSTVRTSVTLKNTGNVPLAPVVTSSASWLSAELKRLALAPGESAEVKL